MSETVCKTGRSCFCRRRPLELPCLLTQRDHNDLRKKHRLRCRAEPRKAAPSSAVCSMKSHVSRTPCLENPDQSLAVRIERRQREHQLLRCRIQAHGQSAWLSGRLPGQGSLQKFCVYTTCRATHQHHLHRVVMTDDAPEQVSCLQKLLRTQVGSKNRHAAHTFVLLQFYVIRVDAPAGGPVVGGGCFVTVESGPWLGHVEALQWAGRAQQPQVSMATRQRPAPVCCLKSPQSKVTREAARALSPQLVLTEPTPTDLVCCADRRRTGDPVPAAHCTSLGLRCSSRRPPMHGSDRHDNIAGSPQQVRRTLLCRRLPRLHCVLAE